MIKSLLLMLGLSSLVCADSVSFPKLYNSESTTQEDPPPAQEAVKMFDLPEGFSVNLFASEPMVQNPIAMTWDDKGRMWIAENYTYAERGMRFDFNLNDRIIILRDVDGDGKADERKVFYDQLKALTSVEVGRGGVWAMCPPNLIFIPDANGDDQADGPVQIKLDGFEIASSNGHNFANGLRWGPDGWLYGRVGHSCPGFIGTPGTPREQRHFIKGGMWRYHLERDTFEALSHGTTNPWGHDWNEFGELFFINTVTGHLWHSFPGAHFKEKGGASENPGVYERIDMHADHYHFDTTGSWTASRGGKANSFGGGHAHIGAMIYQGTEWPEAYRGKLYTLNLHGLRTNVEKLVRSGSGYVAQHQDDIFVMKDIWYRGMDIRQGPDGQAYIIDWSDIGECHDNTGVHRLSGRVYRMAYGSSKPTSLNFKALTADLLKSYIEQDNVLIYRHLLRFVSDQTAFGKPLGQESLDVIKACLKDENPVYRVRALWLLNVMGQSTKEGLLQVLKDPHESMRAWAIRLLTDDMPIDFIDGMKGHQIPPALPKHVLETFVDLASKDASGLVRLTLGSTLQRLNLEQRLLLAEALMTREEDAHDHNLPVLVWTALTANAKATPERLAETLAKSSWSDVWLWATRYTTEKIDQDKESIHSILKASMSQSLEIQESVLKGLSLALKGWRKAEKPGAWSDFIENLNHKGSIESIARIKELNVVFGEGVDLKSIESMVLNKKSDLANRRSGLNTLIQQKVPGLKKVALKLLSDRDLQVQAGKALAQFEDVDIALKIVQRFRHFKLNEKPQMVDVLVSRPAWAKMLLSHIKNGAIPKGSLSAFQARQIRNFGQAELNELLTQSWGEIKDSSQDKLDWIKTWKTKLQQDDLKRDLSHGRQVFQMICSACHTMYGVGGTIGPDLTGSGRSDLDYLLENIADPSAVVSADYMMTNFTLKDGRVLSGVITRETDKTIELKSSLEVLTLSKDDIKERETIKTSLMPEGLVTALSDQDVIDLISYLQHPKQVELK